MHNQIQLGKAFGVSTPRVSQLKHQSDKARQQILQQAEKFAKVPKFKKRVRVQVMLSPLTTVALLLDLLSCLVGLVFQLAHTFSSLLCLRLCWLQEGEFVELDETCFEWYSKVKAGKVPLSPELLKTQAAQVAKRLLDEYKDADDATKKKLHYEALKRFKASDGWLRGWERRYGVSWGKLSGEAASVDMEVVAQGREDLIKILEEYQPDAIYNLDEAALFYQLPPDKSLMSSKQERGTKRSKTRVTLVFVLNMNGQDKFPVLLIGKSKRPKCFGKMKVCNRSCFFRDLCSGLLALPRF